MFLSTAKKFTRGNIYPVIFEAMALPSSSRLLLIGSGPGFADILNEKGIAFEACDIDKAREPDFLWDITQTYDGESTYDTVLCIEVLEHVADPRQAVQNMLAVLNANGRLIISTPFGFETHDAVDCSRILPDFIKQFDDGNVEITVQAVQYNFILAMLLRAASRKRKWQKLIWLIFAPLWVASAWLTYKLIDTDRLWGHSVYVIAKKQA